MRINVSNNNAVVIDEQEVEDVDSFDYVGARKTKHGMRKRLEGGLKVETRRALLHVFLVPSP